MGRQPATEEGPPPVSSSPVVAGDLAAPESSSAGDGSSTSKDDRSDSAMPPVPDEARRPAVRSPIGPQISGAARYMLSGQRGRVVLGALGGLIVLALLLALLPGMPHSGLAQSPGASGPAASTPTPVPKPAATVGTPVPALAPLGTSVATARVVGVGAHLLAPQEAVQLHNGTIAVVDTGNKRLALLSAQGALLKSVRGGSKPFQQPYAMAASGDTIYVLDSEADFIDRFNASGAFRGEVIHDPVLHQARGMALGPHGTLVIANPSSNSVVTISTRGDILRHVGGPVGSGPDQFNQPSDVSVGGDGSVFVLDNNNQRVQVLTATGAFVRHFPAPASSTLASSHVLPLPGGRLLVSDPTGSLLLYPNETGAPTRIQVRLRGLLSTHIAPLGMSLMSSGHVLVTDTAGNRLLELALPHH